jgi:hypothetical protein
MLMIGTSSSATHAHRTRKAATGRRRRRYASPETIRRIIEAAQSCGVPVRCIEVSAEGSVRVFDLPEPSRVAADEFERWEARL